jgi:hypothetical protein
MKIFSSCIPVSFFDSKKQNISIDKLSKKLEDYISKNKNLEMNACHKTAIQIAVIDNGITKETKKQLIESLCDNYSEQYKQLMNVGESQLYPRLVTDSMKSGFLNFVKEDGSLCHTAYIKEHNGSHEYYHANYSAIDKAIIDQCGFDAMNQINGTSISHYSMNINSVDAINEFMLLNKWRVSFCPAEHFA